MTLLNSLRYGFSRDDAQPGAANDDRSDDSQPLPGYDRISVKNLIPVLSKHSQVELTAIDTYERAHKKRSPVFDKLRYLRGKEPLQGYDALSVKEILVGLEGADMATLRKTRVYERKFQRRPGVLENVAAALHADPLPRTADDRPGAGE
jgi:hypothetical protein